MHSLKLAFRTLFKTPVVTSVAILSLALGIGANVAIFSLFDKILLRSLPVQEPERLVNLAAPGPKPGSSSCGQAGSCDAIFSYPMFRDLEQARTGLSGIAAHRDFEANLAYGKQTLNGEGMLVSGSYFPLLGVRPALGRLLGPGDDRTLGGHPVAVLSHGYWETQFGASPEVLNRTLVVNGQPLTIVGVAPRGFEGTTFGLRPKVFVPLSMRGLMVPGFDGFANRRDYWAYLFARLEPGVTPEQAQKALNGVYQRIVIDVEAPLQEGMSEQTMTRFRNKEVTLEPGWRGQSAVYGEVRVVLVLLLSVTGIVLLIACANLANILLARGAGRSMEIAVRMALGASRGKVLAQLLTESLLLALLGGAASLLVAQWTLVLMASLLPAEEASILTLELRWSVVLFAAAVSVGTGLLFGMFPALQSTRPDLISSIRASSGQIAGARASARFRTTLVTAQIALALALLVSAGLFLKSLRNVSRAELGLRTENLVRFAVSPELNGYDSTRAGILFERLEEELAGLPGVTGVSDALVPVLGGGTWWSNVSVEGFEAGPDTDTNTGVNAVGADYFRTLGVPLLAGREFTRADNAGAPRVAVVNEAFARKFGLGREPIGKRMAIGGSDELGIEIVGLVRDATYDEVRDVMPPTFFMPYRQSGRVGALTFYVRTSGDPRQVLRAVPGVVARLDPSLPVEELKTMAQQVRENLSLDRLMSTLSTAFAVLATLLAAIGLYGVLAYTVAQRTREIGVRMALGASVRDIRGLVLRQVGGMVLAGGTVGVLLALGLGRAARSVLYEVEGQDPLVVGLSVALLALVGLGAGYFPARRASRVDPMQALRYE